MSEREAIRKLLISWEPLRALVKDRVHPGWVHTGPRPYITITRISKPRVRTLQGYCGLAHPRFQIDCWADDQATADAVAGEVENRLDDYHGDDTGLTIQWAYIEEQQDFPEPPAASGRPLFRQSIDLIVWFEEQ